MAKRTSERLCRSERLARVQRPDKLNPLCVCQLRARLFVLHEAEYAESGRGIVRVNVFVDRPQGGPGAVRACWQCCAGFVLPLP